MATNLEVERLHFDVGIIWHFFGDHHLQSHDTMTLWVMTLVHQTTDLLISTAPALTAAKADLATGTINLLGRRKACLPLSGSSNRNTHFVPTSPFTQSSEPPVARYWTSGADPTWNWKTITENQLLGKTFSKLPCKCLDLQSHGRWPPTWHEPSCPDLSSLEWA